MMRTQTPLADQYQIQNQPNFLPQLQEEKSQEVGSIKNVWVENFEE